MLALATAPLIGAFFHSSEITALAAASSGTIFLRTIATTPDALLQRQFSFVRRLFIEPAQVLAFGIAAVLAAEAHLGPWALVIGQYVGYGVDALLAWIMVRWRPNLRLVSYAMWRELVGYGRHIFVATVVLRVGDQFSTLVLGRALGPASLGQFRYAGRLAGTPFGLLLACAAYVLFPAFSHIADDSPRLEGAFLRSLRWICVVSFPAGLIFVPLGIPTVVIVFGEVWRPAGEALIAMCLLPAGACSPRSSPRRSRRSGSRVPHPAAPGHRRGHRGEPHRALQVRPDRGRRERLDRRLVDGRDGLVLMHRVAHTPLGKMVAEVWPSASAATVAALVHPPDRGLRRRCCSAWRRARLRAPRRRSAGVRTDRRRRCCA